MTILTHIQKHQLGLVFRHGDLVRVLEPGTAFVPGRIFGQDQILVFDKLDTQLRHRKLDALLLEPAIVEHVHVVDVADDQRALVWKDGRLGWILGSGRHAFWKEPARIEVETFDVTSPRFVHPRLAAVMAHEDAGRFLLAIRVETHARVLVFVDGELLENVGPGRHVFWQGQGYVKFQEVDLREKVLEIAGQDIMTSDRVTLRLTLIVTVKVVDPVAATSVVVDHEQAVYRAAQLALRSAVGARTLDELLVSKDDVGAEVREAVRLRAAEFGVEVRGVGVRDVVLPGDMKDILNQVIQARKEAEANLIRRQEETAAARSQANTARLLRDNPVLVRMKELEALQQILAGTKATFVLGSGDLGEQVKSLLAGARNGDDD